MCGHAGRWPLLVALTSTIALSLLQSSGRRDVDVLLLAEHWAANTGQLRRRHGRSRRHLARHGLAGEDVIPTACGLDCLRSGLLLVPAGRSIVTVPRVVDVPLVVCQISLPGKENFQLDWHALLSDSPTSFQEIAMVRCSRLTSLLSHDKAVTVMCHALWGFSQDDTFKPLAQNVTPLPSVRQRLSLDTVADVAKTLPTFRSVLHAMNVDVALEPQPQSVDV